MMGVFLMACQTNPLESEKAVDSRTQESDYDSAADSDSEFIPPPFDTASCELPELEEPSCTLLNPGRLDSDGYGSKRWIGSFPLPGGYSIFNEESDCPSYGVDESGDYWMGDCSSEDGMIYFGSVYRTVDGTYDFYQLMEGYYLYLDYYASIQGSEDPDVLDGAWMVNGLYSYVNQILYNNYYIMEAGEDWCVEAFIDYWPLYTTGCDDEGEGWNRIIGETTAIHTFNGYENCDGCGCLIWEDAPAEQWCIGH
jgi:hypothetical protein